MKTILVYVQHLLGIGHLHRTAELTKALAQSGYKVTVVSGGVNEAGLNFGEVNLIQLPAIKSDAKFSALYDQYGSKIDDDFKQTRKEKLLKVYSALRPDGVLIETYPFGRRQMRFELLPLLEKIHAQSQSRPWVGCSIRDVIQPKSNENRIREIVDIIDKYFDVIFVHGDESFIRFEQTFPQAKQFKEKLFYTGYIVKNKTLTKAVSRDKQTLLVSAGGGAVGKKLYQTVIQVSQEKLPQSYKWHLLVGNNLEDEQFNKLLRSQTDQLVIERNRTDFLEMLSGCCVSISQAGYNTIMDLLITQTPAIVVPFEGVGEKEQLIRANALAENNAMIVVREKNLDSVALLKALQQSQYCSYQKLKINLHGAKRMVQFLDEKY